MSDTILFQDNTYGTIASGIGTTDTSISLTSRHGARFPTVVAGQVLYATLVSAANVVEEIHITAHAAASDTLTVTRAANGTVAKTWASGDRIECRLTSEHLSAIAYIASAQTWTAKQTFTSPIKLQEALEKVTISASNATGTINYDVITQGIMYYNADAGGNWTLNIRGDGSNSLDSIMATGESITVNFAVQQGATPYYNSAVTIDGGAVTPKWLNGAPTAGDASSTNLYSYTIVKTGSATFTVFASKARYA